MADWQILGDIITGDNTSSEFGANVSISADGTRIAVGVPGQTVITTQDGKVTIYDFDGSDWLPTGSIIGQVSLERIGDSISLSPDGLRLAIGVPSANKRGNI